MVSAGCQRLNAVFQHAPINTTTLPTSAFSSSVRQGTSSSRGSCCTSSSAVGTSTPSSVHTSLSANRPAASSHQDTKHKQANGVRESLSMRCPVTRGCARRQGVPVPGSVPGSGMQLPTQCQLLCLLWWARVYCVHEQATTTKALTFRFTGCHPGVVLAALYHCPECVCVEVQHGSTCIQRPQRITMGYVCVHQGSWWCAVALALQPAAGAGQQNNSAHRMQLRVVAAPAMTRPARRQCMVAAGGVGCYQ